MQLSYIFNSIIDVVIIIILFLSIHSVVKLKLYKLVQASKNLESLTSEEHVGTLEVHEFVL